MTSPRPEFGPQGTTYSEPAEEAVPALPTDDEGSLTGLGRDRQVELDNAARAPGRICELCGTVITASQDARLEPDGRWIHESCPVPPEELYSTG
jgi:hypothetical protein